MVDAGLDGIVKAEGGGGGVSGGVEVETGSEWETVAVACQRIAQPIAEEEVSGHMSDGARGEGVGADTSLEHPPALVVWLEIRR